MDFRASNTKVLTCELNLKAPRTRTKWFTETMLCLHSGTFPSSLLVLEEHKTGPVGRAQGPLEEAGFTVEATRWQSGRNAEEPVLPELEAWERHRRRLNAPGREDNRPALAVLHALALQYLLTVFH